MKVMLKLVSRRLHPYFFSVVVLGLALAVCYGVLLKPKPASAGGGDPPPVAAPVCFLPGTSVPEPGTALPRTGTARNRDVAGCPPVPETTWFGANTTETNGGHIFLSSYYANSDGSPGSTLHTPYALFSVYSAGLTKPTTPQSVRVTVWYCRSYSVTAVFVSKGTTVIGNHHQTVTFTPDEFAFDVASNRYKTTNDVRAFIINPNSTSMACKISANVQTSGAIIGLTPDGSREDPATNGVPQRYNQDNWNRNVNPNKAVLGPPNGYGAIALRTDVKKADGSQARLEYAFSFKPDCNITTPRTVFLKIYDADGPSSLNPPATQNGTYDGIDYFPKMLVYEYDSNGNYMQTINPTGDDAYRVRIGNDEFGQYALTVTPTRKYTWVFWNVGSSNGLQIWMPFAEITGHSSFSCPPPSCTLSANPSFVLPGGSTTLSWTTTNAALFSVDQGVGNLTPASGGSVAVSPGASSKTYTGTASGAGGSRTCSVTVSVISGVLSCDLNPIVTIEPGESYTPVIHFRYTGPPNVVTVTATVTVNGVTRTLGPIGGPLPNGFQISLPVGPAIPFPNAGNFTVVTKSISGTVGGTPYGPSTCGGAIFVPVAAKPYFKVFNGGALVGAAFNSGTTTCITAGTGRVSSFSRYFFDPVTRVDSFQGASTQYELRARGLIDPTTAAFWSSGGRPTALPLYRALTFANNIASETYGGNFGGSACMTDYYTTTRNASVPVVAAVPGSTPLATLNARASSNQVEWGGGTLSGGNLPLSSRLVVYVTGNVHITGNITLNAANADYASIADIPFFALVVKGNITIAPGVNQLDGLYIAQPKDDGTGGTVYTCLNADNTVPNLYTSACRTNKLTFNGSVVAKSIRLLRTNGTLSQGAVNETSASNNIAEVFNAMTELFIANPAFKLDDSATRLYDSITTLPPLL